MKRITFVALSLALLLSFSAVAASAQNKPTVAIIRADWCTACQKLEPTMMELMKQYGSKMNFVMFDVTNDESTAMAAAKAKSLGLSRFFNANKKMTSTVAVFNGKKQLFKTAKNYDKAEYMMAFDKAIE